MIGRKTRVLGEHGEVLHEVDSSKSSPKAALLRRLRRPPQDRRRERGPPTPEPTPEPTSLGSAERQRASVGKISARCCSFSAVSATIFATKYAFCSIFQNLPDYLAEIFEIWKNFADFATFAIRLLNVC